MSFSLEGFARFGGGRMLSPEVRLIGESSNDNPAHLHGDSNITSDQVSSVHIGNVVASGVMVCHH